MVGADQRYHRELAAGALRVCESFDGVVDLGGVLSDAEGVHGKRIAISCETALGECSTYWAVDATWLREWMAHPKFKMVK